MYYKPLSENQNKVFEAILSKIASNEDAPSLREIQKITGIKSLRGVTLQLDTLEKLGFIERKKGVKGMSVNAAFLKPKEKISIPFMASIIPAGYASPAEDYSDQKIDVSLSDTKGMRNVFAVKIKGESMINAGIEDGDIAIISPQQVANNGDIVAALSEEGVTLKRFRIVDDIPMLVPANPKYKPIIGDFQIQGKLINLIKTEQTN
ncbi:MAG: LexA repressor [Candidatus Woesebacteria bacterium GW2011_GWB1_43_14]|uniref:LexA repressor n=1 Tax=Candidatus Woesebacteria bacterium GW2011_GWB1_43_14 TaxID=1618578 RepID=A0A0G1DMZ2_9BACT|nr:MAG: LexA repressor [Candidatus Woesebacteria bacterium GW2011_GWA1_39_11b]KKS78205.1 MAG: LexA repressor [Candidatus Woesebacteria bacterium GW2011_GWC1_42_9]KKS98942.1 MAG: LexA repressor [Candidatus Woesebacteria bacterium GW2011_GWB1_43_14]